MIPTGPRYPPLFPALARRKLRSRSAHTATERHSCLSVTAGGHGRSGLDDTSSGRNPERLSRSLLTGLILGRAVRGTVPSWLANVLSLGLTSGGTQVRQNSRAYSLRFRGDRRRCGLTLRWGSLNAASEALEDHFGLSKRLILSGSDGEVLRNISLRQIGRNGIKPVISTSKR